MTPEEEQQQTKEKRHLTLDKLKDPSFMKRSYETTEYSSYLCTVQTTLQSCLLKWSKKALLL